MSDEYLPVVTNHIQSKMPTIIIASLTFVAGLAWNDAIKAIIDNYVPPEYKNHKNAWYKVLYAFIVTILIVVMISSISYYFKIN